MSSKTLTLKLGHSPDPDDAFMFYGLAKDKFPTGPYKFEHILQDIQTLNQRALKGELEMTAISIHAYPYVADKYALMSCATRNASITPRVETSASASASTTPRRPAATAIGRRSRSATRS